MLEDDEGTELARFAAPCRSSGGYLGVIETTLPDQPCVLELTTRLLRGSEVIEAMKTYGAVYFGATGGCGALLSKCIKKSEIIAYEDLGAEAIRRLEVEDFPVTVIIDSEGNNLYETGRAEYLRGEGI